MKIIFINNLRLPTEKAYGQSIASMASALASAKVEVEVIGRKGQVETSFFNFYDIADNFKFKTLTGPRLLSPRWGRFSDYLNRILFLTVLFKQKFSSDSIFITRQPEIAWFLGLRGYEVVFDAHRFPDHFGLSLVWLIKKVKFVSANSHGTAKAFEQAGFYRVKVLPNGVDLKRFDLPAKENRGRIALYLGHLYEWKGVEVILATASLAPDILFKIAGGPETERKKLEILSTERNLKNVEFVGIIPSAQVAAYLKGADVLIYSARADSIEARLYTSPIKLFEYLASGVPAVVADLPSVREIVTEQHVTFYSPGKASSLAVALHTILIDPISANMKAAAGRELMKQYTWQQRADKLLYYLNS